MKKYKIKLDGGGHSKKVIIMKNRDNMRDKREILTERLRERENNTCTAAYPLAR